MKCLVRLLHCGLQYVPYVLPAYMCICVCVFVCVCMCVFGYMHILLSVCSCEFSLCASLKVKRALEAESLGTRLQTFLAYQFKGQALVRGKVWE